jgi:hypothetical protein
MDASSAESCVAPDQLILCESRTWVYLPMRRVIEDIILLAECSDQDEWEGQVVYLPL